MKKFLLSLFAVLMLPVALGAQPIQKIMGHYANDAISESGFSVGNSGTLSIAIILEPEELETNPQSPIPIVNEYYLFFLLIKNKYILKIIY